MFQYFKQIKMNNIHENNSIKRTKRKQYKPYKIYLPQNLDLDAVLINNSPSFKRMPESYRNMRDKMAYILHLINAIPHAKKDFDFDKEKGYTPINKALLSRKIHDYAVYIYYLKKQGIIEEGNLYQVGIKSRGLKFTPKYRTPVKTDYITTNSLIKSILIKRLDRDLDAIEKLCFFKEHLNSDLTINYDNALSILEADKENAKIKLIRKRENYNYTQDELIKLPSIEDAVLQGYNSKWITLEKIHSADYTEHPFIDGTTGRLHSPFVILYKKLRHLLRYKGEVLGNVDIVNSQPFLSIILLDLEVFNRLRIDNLIAKYNPLFRSTMHKDEDGNIVSIIPSNYSTMLVNLIKSVEHKPDVVNFKKAIISGTYYEYFAGQLLKRGLIPDYLLEITDTSERDKAIRGYAKTATFRAFFDKVNAKRWSNEVKVFAECFPNVYRIFQSVKRGKKNHRTLACILQKVESRLVLHNVCVDIHNNHPEIPLFTIHDSIATTKANIDIVMYYFKKHIKDFIGIEPQIKPEIWV